MGANEKVPATFHETTYTPAELVEAAKVMFGQSWEPGHPSFHSEDWLYWRTAHALEVTLARLEGVDVHDVELLRAEKAALAAVIEQIRQEAGTDEFWHAAGPNLDRLLAGVDTDAALREVRAKAWDEALAAVDDKWAERFSELTVNPYREGRA